MKLWVGDYIGDTLHLTAEEHGAYLLLLMSMWKQGGYLPDDKIRLCRIAKVHPPRWARVFESIRPFFQFEDGRITSKRLLMELENARHKSRSCSEAAKAKHLKDKGATPADAERTPCHHSHSHSHKKERGAKAPKVFNENLFSEFWDAYPKKAAKGDARRAYLKALSRASHAEILAGAKRYKPDPNFTKNPATWLNADCWLDEVPKTNGTVARGPWKPLPSVVDPVKPPPEERDRQLQRLMKARLA
jgi:uncharacterized protein YdaU (DUF1376 family)